MLDCIEFIVVKEEGAKVIECFKGEAWRENGKFIVGQIDFNQFGEGSDQVEVLQRCLTLAQDQYLHFFRLFYRL